MVCNYSCQHICVVKICYYREAAPFKLFFFQLLSCSYFSVSMATRNIICHLILMINKNLFSSNFDHR